MKPTRLLPFLVLLIAACPCHAATMPKTICPPVMSWQLSLGGTGSDVLQALRALPDGGFLVAGHSDSEPGFTKASPLYGRSDFWVVRLDAEGVTLWEQSFGTSGGEILHDLALTPDGGSILAGFSGPLADGSRTSPAWGRGDFWVIRLNADGHKLWEQSYGGDNQDSPFVIITTRDGGYLVGGNSFSQPGGNKTAPKFGEGADGWVVRLDAHGNILWDQSFGGVLDDGVSCVAQTDDGGFLIGATSRSPIGGNKTSAVLGGSDFWVIRLDANGLKLWERVYGGSDTDELTSLVPTADGGFLLGGRSGSPADGTKTAGLIGFQDIWVMRMDADGNPLWDQAYGSGAFDRLAHAQAAPGGGFLLGGVAGRFNGGTQTSPSFGSTDYWLLRIDEEGDVLWEQSFGGEAADSLSSFDLTPDGGFIVGGRSDSEMTGNKVTPRFGRSDFWMIRLGPEICDADGDGVADDVDQCPDSPPGVVVNADGCTIEQLCPCDGPWRNRWEYFRCVRITARAFLREGLITRQEWRETLRNAIRSDCGKKRWFRPWWHR